VQDIPVEKHQQFPLLALQSLPWMSMGQFDHPFWFRASQMVIQMGVMSVSKQAYFMIEADRTPGDWESPS
jgi:hypothetical protein